MKKLILIRHAERPIIPVNEVGDGILITKKGESDCSQFALHLDGPIVSVRSSPILRCIQSSQIMSRAKGFPIEKIILDKDLGDPGFIIEDGKVAWSHWQKKGHQAVNEYLLSGNEKWSGFKDLTLATNIFKQKIESSLKCSDEGIHLWVTHDTILATFVSRVLADPIPIEKWPDFLGYLEVKSECDKHFNYTYSQTQTK